MDVKPNNPTILNSKLQILLLVVFLVNNKYIFNVVLDHVIVNKKHETAKPSIEFFCDTNGITFIDGNAPDGDNEVLDKGCYYVWYTDK